MTKRFEQQGKKVTVTLIREELLGKMRWLKNLRCCLKSLVIGYVKSCYARMVNPGLPDGPWCLNQPCAALNWPLQNLGKTRSDATCLRHRH